MEEKISESNDTNNVEIFFVNMACFPSPPQRFSLFCDLEKESIDDIKQRVAKRFEYNPSKLDLLWKNKIISEEFHSKTLKEFKIDTTGKIFVQRKKDSLPEDFPINEATVVTPLPNPFFIHQIPSNTESSPQVKDIEVKCNECTICFDNSDDLIKPFGCQHPYNKECVRDLIESEFEKKRKSFLEIACVICQQKLPFEKFQDYAKASSLKEYEAVMKTIPTNPQDPNLNVADFCYKFNEDGVLFHTETLGKFHWVNQVHYDLLGDLIVLYIQNIMKTTFNMKEVFLPLGNNLPPHMCNNIFLTSNALTCSKLMLLIQGSGAVRAGQWARALCINESLKVGSILDYLTEAEKSGFGVIVFNPNLNRAPKEIWRPTRDMFFIPGKPRIPTPETFPIPENDSPTKHSLYVWDQFAKDSAAKEIVIVAHSAGGSCALHLLKEREKELLPRLKAIAFTDSVGSIHPSDPIAVQNFLREHAVNWVQSDEPLDTPEKSYGEGCKCVSSGHPKHENTSASAITSVFKFLNSKVSQDATNSN